MDAFGIVGRYVLGNGKNAGLPLEFDSVGGVNCQFNLAGFGTEPGDHGANRPPALQLRHQQSAVRRILPESQLERGASQEFRPRVTVAPFKGGIDFEKSPLFEGSDRERNREIGRASCRERVLRLV